MTTIFPPLSPREIRGADICRRAAMDGMVLLRNENHTLPLVPGRICMFGNGAVRTIRGGTGSGDPFNGGLSGGGDADVDLSPRYHIHLLPAMQREGFTVLNEAALQKIARRYDEAFRSTSDRVMHTFTFPETPVSDAEAEACAALTDTAVYVISRNSGEGSDRVLDGGYTLSAVEKDSIAALRRVFAKLVILLNVGGPVAAADLLALRADAILLIGQGGQESGAAAAQVLSGAVNPSGRLTATWALHYGDYPGADTYLSDPDTAAYHEGIYVGYRFFDTFGKKPGFAFGFGLSYTEFRTECIGIVIRENILKVTSRITNTGSCAGREVVQVYVSSPSTCLDMPYQELRGFEKTALLQPGQEETLTVDIPLTSLASYREEDSAYILSQGYYIVRVGNASDHTEPAAAVYIREPVKTLCVSHVMPLKQALTTLTGLIGDDHAREAAQLPILEPDCPFVCRDLRTDAPEEAEAFPEAAPCTYRDFMEGKVPAQALAAQLTDEELTEFVCGSGWGVADDSAPIIGANSESVPGAAGETTHALEQTLGIPSLVLADGPGGVRISQVFEATNTSTGMKQTVYHYCTAWPIGTQLAQSFDRALLREVGEGMNADLRAMNIDILLGPGVNIHRNPLCGRNFEYFSEDPLLSGEMAAAITLGIQKDDTAAACIKHFAMNNQETNRHANNSVAGERAIREIYLEPFRISVEKGRAMTIMTSYNLINGVPTANDRDLCTRVARGEWGFDGLIMTDWNGGSSTPAGAMRAGNDLIMPGGYEKSMDILSHMKKLQPAFEPNGQVTKYRIRVPFAEAYIMLWHSYVPSAEGSSTLHVPLGDGFTASEENGLILVNGEKLFCEASTIRQMRRDPAVYTPLRTPVSTRIAHVEDGGRTIVYRVEDTYQQTVRWADVQSCAVSILKVMRRLGKQPV